MLEPFLPSLFLFNLPSDLPSFYATFIPSFLYLSFLRPFIHPYFFPSMLFFVLPLCLDFILISFFPSLCFSSFRLPSLFFSLPSFPPHPSVHILPLHHASFTLLVLPCHQSFLLAFLPSSLLYHSSPSFLFPLFPSIHVPSRRPLFLLAVLLPFPSASLPFFLHPRLPCFSSFEPSFLPFSFGSLLDSCVSFPPLLLFKICKLVAS